jgi:restriction system protein
MAIPDAQWLMRPLLAYGAEKNNKGGIGNLAHTLNLSDDEISQLLPSGKQSRFASRVHWARFYLGKAGALKRIRNAHFAITERGKKLFAENPIQISFAILRQFKRSI